MVVLCTMHPLHPVAVQKLVGSCPDFGRNLSAVRVVKRAEGKFLVKKLRELPDEFEVMKIWNRSVEEPGVQGDIDLVIEVAHPKIIAEYGELILEHCDLIAGSPTCFADQELLEKLKNLSLMHARRLLVPAGALWGANDIQKMADVGNLKGLTVTMIKHPTSFKLGSPLFEINEKAKLQESEETILYEGIQQETICSRIVSSGSNNVNTMAGGALAATNLGFDKVKAKLISDPKMTDWHVVEVRVEGDDGFEVITRRNNPAKPGAVTGQLTYYSFLSSIKESRYKPSGIQLC
ncbi:Protein CBG17998 [Caenorhabditis briggsae]|uniref:Aspartate dehydrogenase domain-containing protein n=1 Tax=Caenorhabditis briggsae TaxID=6238 RepID=A8XSS5_CAEBR|nr:Protein CBG17998 [Caenorhabditis briggsae]CAP35527.1 Protein CBG17998 [Caenorhabditis briggsae]